MFLFFKCIINDFFNLLHSDYLCHFGFNSNNDLVMHLYFELQWKESESFAFPFQVAFNVYTVTKVAIKLIV